jgi:hypothetical protein
MGVIDPLGGFKKNLLSPRNGISQIAEIWKNNGWLPTVDDFRTLGTFS